MSLGEIDAYIKKFKIGKRRQQIIQSTINLAYIIDINYQEIIDQYGDIDAFSQAKFNISGHNFTARNMGKNDLWIAATASHFNLTLLTTDQDFNHLNQAFLSVEYIQPE